MMLRVANIEFRLSKARRDSVDVREGQELAGDKDNMTESSKMGLGRPIFDFMNEFRGSEWTF